MTSVAAGQGRSRRLLMTAGRGEAGVIHVVPVVVATILVTVGAVVASTIDYNGIAVLLAALGAFIGSVAGAVVMLRGQRTIVQKVDAVHVVAEETKAEVVTGNDSKPGEIIQRNEGERVLRDVPEGDRTQLERDAVEMLSSTDQARIRAERERSPDPPPVPE